MASVYTAIIEDGGDGWYWAHSPEVPAANGQGRTPAEAKADLALAIEFVLEVLRDEAINNLAPDALCETVIVG
jgi:predicted RNase H-like HicB family nuclease